jgi:hypothetical protein
MFYKIKLVRKETKDSWTNPFIYKCHADALTASKFWDGSLWKPVIVFYKKRPEGTMFNDYYPKGFLSQPKVSVKDRIAAYLKKQKKALHR